MADATSQGGNWFGAGLSYLHLGYIRSIGPTFYFGRILPAAFLDTPISDLSLFRVLSTSKLSS
jgi:hypothetical protein